MDSGSPGAAQGGHRAAAALSTADLPGECRSRLSEPHREEAAPLAAATRRTLTLIHHGIPAPRQAHA
ncbi:MAG: hypothetical protein ACM3ML_07545 [Micromonosporaceae bacterium]